MVAYIYVYAYICMDTLISISIYAKYKFMSYLYNDTVPPSWIDISYPSMRPLGSWIVDLQRRVDQLNNVFGTGFVSPKCVWISGLFSPQSFLTAVMQTAAQNGGFELDKMMISTEVTKREVDDVEESCPDGVYVYGLSMEGARWDGPGASIQESNPKEILFKMPVLKVKAQYSERGNKSDMYSCPVYRTQQRGPTYITDIKLRTKASTDKWVLAGVVLVMDIV